MSEPHRNPVHSFEGKWWFWDEMWANRKGPYNTAEEAQEGCIDYCLQLNRENPGNPPYPRLEERCPVNDNSTEK